MKANELRIGNFVFEPLNENKNAFKVFEIYHEEDYDKINYFNALNFKPIPLTGKWIESFVGFQYSDGNYWVNLITHYLDLMPSKELWYPTYVQIPEFSSEEEQRISLNAIQYVHELQNLYFSLTGVELQQTAP